MPRNLENLPRKTVVPSDQYNLAESINNLGQPHLAHVKLISSGQRVRRASEADSSWDMKTRSPSDPQQRGSKHAGSRSDPTQTYNETLPILTPWCEGLRSSPTLK